MDRVRINRLDREPDHRPPSKLPPSPTPGGPLRIPFSKGIKTGGRKKGQPNKTHKQVAEAIIDGAERSGYDQRGKDGLAGYMLRLANSYPKTYAYLLARVLPIQLRGRLNYNHEHRVYRTVEEIKGELLDRGIPVERIFH